MEPYLGNIQMFACNFAPKDYAFCDGSQITITQNPALYSLLNTTFGGNSTTYFNLPDLRGRMPVQSSPTLLQGQQGGVETVSLTLPQLPIHIHLVGVTSAEGDAFRPNSPNGSKPTIFAGVAGNALPAYGDLESTTAPLNSLTIGDAPSSNNVGLPHNNVQPSTVIHFCIALKGLYPQRN
ncbi:hypothetical protein BOO91_19495 [Vibrio navarrensis]|uniref:Tail fiber protein n=2 Tax=Vibrionaceae TaxID=641 RepID=A0AAJ4ICK1_9VIBR|nr:hypothetical protein UF06_23000 [Vibrio sp. S234-5]MBE3652708.1 hypothetical protein [Vibrio navarrensis]MBE3656861.1 hypothetical protein [Vibrio navarrensis]MBE3663111.1 hypothetical protein [Vibrio navarrensis]MBE4605730.1 hypothetical protein [Vibrio navarrensis]